MVARLQHEAPGRASFMRDQLGSCDAMPANELPPKTCIVGTISIEVRSTFDGRSSANRRPERVGAGLVPAGKQQLFGALCQWMKCGSWPSAAERETRLPIEHRLYSCGADIAKR